MGEISPSGSQKKTLQFQQKSVLENCHTKEDNSRNHLNEVGFLKNTIVHYGQSPFKIFIVCWRYSPFNVD
jgi:hypothetical protein